MTAPAIPYWPAAMQDELNAMQRSIDAGLDGSVYFALNAEANAVKIGYAGNVAARILQLNSASPSKVHLEYSLMLPKQAERIFHRALSEHRVQGEWFHYNADVLRLINCVVETEMAMIIEGRSVTAQDIAHIIYTWADGGSGETA